METPRTGFNPRSREGSDQNPQGGSHGENVSIHAPVKGATGMAYIEGLYDFVSIHAPVKGATSAYWS